MNARSTIAIAALLCGAAGCAGTQNPPAPGREEFRFMGYRVDVSSNERGMPTSATAYDAQGKAVPTAIIDMRELSVCVPKPLAATAGQSPHCEALSFMTDRTQFKSGTQTLCYLYLGGRIIYYQC